MPEKVAASLSEPAPPPGFVASWRKVALSTAPVDPLAARRAVRNIYAVFGLPQPKAVISLASPVACLVARGILKLLRWDEARLYDDKFFQRFTGELDPFALPVWQAMWGQLQAQVGQRWWPLVEAFSEETGESFDIILQCDTPEWPQHLKQQLWDLTEQRFGADIRDAELLTRLCDSIELQIADYLRTSAFGRSERTLANRRWAPDRYRRVYLDGGTTTQWLSFCEFQEQAGGQYDARSKRQFDAFKEYVRSCGWAYVFPDVAFVSDRPAELHIDDQYRLHRAGGAALRYRDGFSAYAWHGTPVPGFLIEQRDALTPRTIERIAGAELRRVALEIYGFERYLAARNARVVAADELHGQPRRLLEVDVGGQPVRIVEVVNGSLEPDGTRRKFHLGALRGNTPAEVIAASYGIAPAHYREAVRT